jgi:branched-chain amino acid transport system permease protein
VVLYFMLARYAGYSLLFQGGILIAMMLVSPRGIVGPLQRSRHYRRLAEVLKR